nr:gliding motility-associated-like protein [Mucilaginibacter sp. X4EP1]
MPLAGYCQIPTPKWVDDIGGSGDSKPTGMVVDSQNNIYISGYFSGTVDFDPSPGVKNLTSNGGYDIYVAEYKPDGTLIWAESMGGTGLDQVNSMSIDKDNNITLIGQFQSPSFDADPGPGVATLQNNGGDDIFVIHLNGSGGFLWAKAIGGPDTDRGQEVSSDSQDNVITTSIFQSTITVSGNQLTALGGFNGLIIKYDPSGNLLWAVNIGQTNDTGVFGNRTDSSGNIIVSGAYSGAVNFNPLGSSHVLNSVSLNNPFVAKYSPSGQLIWIAQVTGSLVNNQSVISLDSQNNIYFTGAFNAPLTFNGTATVNPKGSSDVFIAKYLPNGTFQFVKSMGGVGASGYVYQLENDQNNNVYFTGYFSGTINFNPATGATANLTYHGQTDFFLAKYDSNGNYDYAFNAGNSNCGQTLGIELALDNTNDAVLAGSFCSTVNFDASGCTTDKLTAINGISDSFIAVYGSGSPSTITNNVITAPAVTGFCAGGSPVTILGSVPLGGNGNYIYQWQSSTDNVNFTDVVGATSQNYQPPTLSATTYFRRVVSAGSCALPLNSNVISINVQPALTNNIITAPNITNFCDVGSPSTITGSVAGGGDGTTYAYQWQSSTDNSTFNDIVGATSLNYTPPSLNVTTYYRRAVTSGFCIMPLLSNVVTIQIAAVPAVPTISAVSVCAGTPATLSIASPQQGVTYNWYDSASKTNLLFTGITYVTGALNTSASFYVEAVNGTCSSATLANAQANVFGVPNAPSVINNNVAVCNGSVATLNILNPQVGLTYNWYAVATGGSAVYTGVDFVTPVITAGTMYYAEAVNNNACVSGSRTAVIVAINPIPQLTVQNSAICPGSNATLTATSSDPSVTINWYATATDNNILYSGGSFVTSTINTATSYYAQAVDNNTGCMSTRSVAQVNILQQLTAPVVTVESTTSSSVTFQWDAVDGATGYQVSIDNGQTFTNPSSGSNGLTHTISGLQPEQSVTILVQALGATACQLSGSSTAVTAQAVNLFSNVIYVPNAFTPNGDGNNDIVYVHSESIRSLKFYIYDQWGELLYTSTSQQSGWDGSYRGKKEPVGVYVYYLEAIMNDGKQINKKGTITLLR